MGVVTFHSCTGVNMNESVTGGVVDEILPAPRSLTRRQLEKLVADRNARFDALTPAERRMAIAREVLDLTSRRVLVPRQGHYVDNVDGCYDINLYGPAQKVADNPKLRCNVCQIGAAVVVAVKLFDRVPGEHSMLGSLATPSLREDYLDRFFSREQQALMECAFETDTSFRHYMTPSLELEAAEKAVAFGNRYEGELPRFRAIWRNVLRNGGTFIP